MTHPDQRLGLFGGTFNPVHLGHLRAAEEIAGLLQLDRLLFIPAAVPPHKKPEPPISLTHRLAMLRLAVMGRPGFEVSDVEGRREGPSYTVETLKHFRGRTSGADLFFITGVDAFFDIESWKDFRELFSLACFVVISRPGVDGDRLSHFLDRICPGYEWRSGEGAFFCAGGKSLYYRDVTRLDISSTDIRERLGRKESIRYLVPDRVLKYIMEKGLYQKDDQREEGVIQ